MDSIGSTIARLPVAGSLYTRNAATVKREICLLLHRFGLLGPITFVQWLATWGCNFRCSFCEASAGARREDELTADEVVSLIDDLARMGTKRLVVSGGEPLLREDMPALLRHAHDRGLSLGLVTNGWRAAEFWPRIGELRYFLYFTSLDGPREFHDSVRARGSFDRVLEGLRLSAETRIPTRMVNTVVQKENLQHLSAILEIVKRSGATAWHLTPLAQVGRAFHDDGVGLEGEGLRELVAFVREARKVFNVDLGESHGYLGCLAGSPIGKPFFCGAGLTRCSVMPDGTVLGCHQVYDGSLGEGNIRRRPFSEIWKTEFRRFRTRSTPSSCVGCQHLGACRGGCWAEMTLHGQCLKSRWEATEVPQREESKAVT